MIFFELFCMVNDFAKYFAKCCNLYIYIFCFFYLDIFVVILFKELDDAGSR